MQCCARTALSAQSHARTTVRYTSGAGTALELTAVLYSIVIMCGAGTAL